MTPPDKIDLVEQVNQGDSSSSSDAKRQSVMRPATEAPVKLERVANVTVEPAACYTVRNGWAWAHIFVRHGEGTTHAGDPRGWVHVSILSDYGSFGYCWSHIGGEPWQQFLAGVGFDYAMQKMMGDRFQTPLSIDDARAKTRKIVLEQRREDSMCRKDARLLWDALDDCYDGPPAHFLQDLDRASDGAMYRHSLWDYRWEEPSAQARGFWAEIWPHFIEALTSGDGAQDASALGNSGTDPKATGAQS